ncbi:DUF58 domain-containing protein [Pseudenhygromyxa sp. WMMC2535]|uniref:DUF58 domain-containing protein n=1 Tax=Pseudenhygromyxa sp. WMMC2535 TaxID=2712867 RepID=UPI0015561D54|nr:DUF58 domain-containing protein [Pseudenhygromyxa sp. WMMC2535]NVB38315.1 DUF58 domain-containing protein [Pseudenhygromyxa sp. WMMC2535]
MLVPNRTLVWLAIVPVILAAMVPFDESLKQPMWIVDAGLVTLALLDAALTRGKLVTLSRRCPEVFSIGRQNPVTIELRSRARRRLKVELTCELFDHAEAPELPLTVKLRPGRRAVERFRITPRKRGAHVLGDMIVRYPSALGLWKKQVRFPAHQRVRVYPDVQQVRTWELLARQDRQHALMRTSRRLGGESEFEQLRDYSRDDEFRSIDWKATARRGKLTARQYQLESNQNVVFALDAGRTMTAEAEGISLYDHALNASLMLAHVASRGGDRVGLLSYADTLQTLVPPSGGRKAVQKLIQASYALHPELVESDPEQAFHLLNSRIRQRTMVVIFTQVIDERAAEELLRISRGLYPRHLPLIVLFRDLEVDALLEGRLAADGSPAPQASAAMSTSAAPVALGPRRASDLDLYTRGAAAGLLSWREGLIRQLKGQGALILDVSPRDLTPALINRYLEIKARHLL